jgi:hypothetical protein
MATIDWANADIETLTREASARYRTIKDTPRCELTEPERSLLDHVNEFARSLPLVYQVYVPAEDA